MMRLQVLLLVGLACASALGVHGQRDEWTLPSNVYQWHELTVEGDVLAEAQLHAKLRAEALTWAEEEVEPEVEKIEEAEQDIARSVGWHRDETRTTQVYTDEQIAKLNAMSMEKAGAILKRTGDLAKKVSKNSKKLDERLLKHCDSSKGDCVKYQELLALHKTLDGRKDSDLSAEDKKAEAAKVPGGSYTVNYFDPSLANGQWSAQPYMPGYAFYHNPGFDIDALYEEFSGPVEGNAAGNEEDAFLGTGARVSSCPWYRVDCHAVSAYRATKRVAVNTYKTASRHVSRAYNHVKRKVTETIDNARTLYNAAKKYWRGKRSKGYKKRASEGTTGDPNSAKCQQCKSSKGSSSKDCIQVCTKGNVQKSTFLRQTRAIAERFKHLIPAIYVAGISGNINYLVGGAELVYDWSVGQAAWFYYGGASAGTNFLSAGGIGLYGGPGWKGRKVFDDDLGKAYSEYFLGIDVGIDVGVGSVYGQVCVSAKPINFKFGQIPLATYPVFNEVITAGTGFTVSYSVPTAVGANVASTYYWLGRQWSCTSVVCQIAAVALSPSGPIAKAGQTALVWRWYCKRNPSSWVCRIFN
eukprot:TRINITY_DN3865_c0_g1_i1.p1 TRINITY_DN3865_c0_g1~~TRINITY_DN3865_c0_g1_i1.p1  ORF type:complete len:581 (-),score=165.77 TRINITY_DN3865_c0_g1_i1:147-1889(-)